MLKTGARDSYCEKYLHTRVQIIFNTKQTSISNKLGSEGEIAFSGKNLNINGFHFTLQ